MFLVRRLVHMRLRLFFVLIFMLDCLALSADGDKQAKLNPHKTDGDALPDTLTDVPEYVKYGPLVSAAAMLIGIGIVIIILKISIQKLLTWLKFVRNGGSFLPKSGDRKFKLFTPKEINLATANFAQGRLLGQGGQGTVYWGALENRAQLAIKVANAVSKKMREKFINEAVILTKLNHPHIVGLLGFCLNTDTPVLVYEYVEGKTLGDYIHQKANYEVSWDVYHRIMVQLAEALNFIHTYSHPIYHRDIKPANILLDRNDNAYLADFGLAKVNKKDTHLLKLSSCVGTPGFMCPEMFNHMDYNDKSDVYLFGLVLTEMLTGQKILDSILEGGLARHFYECVELGRWDAIFDKRIVTDDNKEILWNIALVSQACIRSKRAGRPDMKVVLDVLEGAPIPESLLDYKEDELADEYPIFSMTGIDSITYTGSV